MRKASRLFEIIQILRLAKMPVTAARIADTLEVTSRSIYRDIAELQAMRVPIAGGRGIGYVMRPGYDLPPLMFLIEETEAIVLALALLDRTGDTLLRQAAKRVSEKVAAAMPAPLRSMLAANAIHAWGTIAREPGGIDLANVRSAVREEQKLEIGYRDEFGNKTERTIQPIAMIYYSESTNIVAWCELRRGLRNFRSDRVESSKPSGASFKGDGNRLRREWIAGWKTKETLTDLYLTRPQLKIAALQQRPATPPRSPSHPPSAWRFPCPTAPQAGRPLKS